MLPQIRERFRTIGRVVDCCDVHFLAERRELPGRRLSMFAGGGAVAQAALVSELVLGEGVEFFDELRIKFAASLSATQGWMNSQFMPGAE